MDTIDRSETKDRVEAQLREALRVHQELLSTAPHLQEVAQRMADVFRRGGKVFFFGNGGSAADAQHWAAELSGRMYLERDALPAAALTTNASQVTAIANDYGFDAVFARALEALGSSRDMAVGISTSGRSENVVRGLERAHEIGMVTLGFTGREGGAVAGHCDYVVSIPSDDVARIQEGHELCAHVICSTVERLLFPDGEEA